MDELTPNERFEHCIQSVLLHEGGLSTNKRDPGGVTKYGVSLRFLRSIGLDIDGNGSVDEEDIIALTRPGAKQIYRKYWWDKFHYSSFKQLIVVEKVFDMAVNMGSGTAHRLMQIGCNHLLEQPIIVDGILGVQSFNAANTVNGIKLRQELRELAKAHYLSILAKAPALEEFRNGWLNRAKW